MLKSDRHRQYLKKKNSLNIHEKDNYFMGKRNIRQKKITRQVLTENFEFSKQTINLNFKSKKLENLQFCQDDRV